MLIFERGNAVIRSMASRVTVASRNGWLISLTVAVLLLLVVSPTAVRAQPIIASGTFEQNSFVTSNFRTVGRVTMFDFSEHDTLNVRSVARA